MEKTTSNRRYAEYATILLLLGTFFYLMYLITPYEQIEKPLLYLAGVSTLLFTWVTGLLALTFGLIQILLYFIASLPLISSVVAQTALIYAIVYKWVFSIIFKKTVVRVPYFQRLNQKIMQNPRVIKIKNGVDKNLKKFGLSEPKQYKILEVNRCSNCRTWKPVNSKYCPNCGDNAQ